MNFIDLTLEEMQRLAAGAKFITIKRMANNHALPDGTEEGCYWARLRVGDKKRYALHPVSALQLNDRWDVVMQRIN